MKILQSVVVGGPQTLQLSDVPAPRPGRGQVLVDVKACGVNFPDVLIIEDKYQTKLERPFSPGAEIAGVVRELGDGVTGLRVGDRILAMLTVTWGGMAEQRVLDADSAVKIPDEMPFDEAAAFMLTYGTSYHALKQRAQLTPGDRLLILGAAGGVGLAAIQLGKAMGATVVAAASSQEKVDFCISQGADSGVVYDRGPLGRDGQKVFGAQLKAAGGADGFNVVYDSVGGDYAEPALRACAWEARYLVVGFAAGEIPRLPLNLTLLKGCDIRGVWWGAWLDRNAETHRQNNRDLLDLYKAGKIRPYVSERFPLEAGGDAIAHLASRKALGKVVVTMG